MEFICFPDENGKPTFTEAQLDALDEAGYETPQSWADATDDQLLAVEGIDADTVRRWRAYWATPPWLRPTGFERGDG